MKRLILALLLIPNLAFAATSSISVTEGSGKNIATNSVSEDAATKELQRVVPNTSAGVESGTAASPLQVSLANTGANATAVKVDGTGGSFPVTDSGGVLTVDGTVAVTNAGITTIAGAVAGTEMQVDVLTMPTTTVQATNLDIRDLASASDSVSAVCTNAGTFATQATLAAETTKVIGTVNIAAAQTVAAVTSITNAVAVTNADVTSSKTALELLDNSVDGNYLNTNMNLAGTDVTAGAGAVAAGTPRVTLASDDPAVALLGTIDADTSDIKTAVEVIDNIVSGSEAQVDVVAALPTGTNIIGAVKRDVVNYTPINKYYTNAGAVTDGIVWSPAAGKKWVITDIIMNTSAAATVTIENDLAGGDSAIMKFELAANGGVSTNFQTPFVGTEDDADLIITTSAGNIYLNILGYEQD